MNRRKKIVIFAHCILNVNSKVDGLALYAGALKSFVSGYIEKDYGIIQLPCPETVYCGLQRWGMTRNQYYNPGYIKCCRELLIPVVDQIKQYRKNGYQIEEIVCVDGSPSCGLNLTCEGFKGGLPGSGASDQSLFREIKGKGIFIDMLDKMLKEAGLKIKYKAINEKAVS